MFMLFCISQKYFHFLSNMKWKPFVLYMIMITFHKRFLLYTRNDGFLILKIKTREPNVTYTKCSHLFTTFIKMHSVEFHEFMLDPNKYSIHSIYAWHRVHSLAIERFVYVIMPVKTSTTKKCLKVSSKVDFFFTKVYVLINFWFGVKYRHLNEREKTDMFTLRKIDYIMPIMPYEMIV